MVFRLASNLFKSIPLILVKVQFGRHMSVLVNQRTGNIRLLDVGLSE